MDKLYRTAKFRVLMGHSFGGTFATYSLLTNPELFNAYIAISPNLHYDDSYLVKQAKTLLKSKYKTQMFFYMTLGYERNYFEPLKEFSGIIEEKSGEAIDFQYTIMEKENHGSVPHLSIYNGLTYIFSGFFFPQNKINEGLTAMDDHYIKVSDKYGYQVKTPEAYINVLGYTYLQNEEIDKAIGVFKENIERYPKSANVYDSLGEAYENNAHLDLAEINYQKAHDLGTRNGDPNTGIYHTNLLRVQGNK
jgi:tetratricopeptide (TPR) repeat protein